MNALKRIGNTRNDIEWDTTVTDRSTGRFLRHIPIYSSVRWENIQYMSTNMKTLSRTGTGRNDIAYSEILFKVYPGGVDAFYSYTPSYSQNPYSIILTGFYTGENGYFSIDSMDNSGYIVSYVNNTYSTAIPIQQLRFLIEKIGAPGTADDFINDILNYYNNIQISTSSNVYTYAITGATKTDFTSVDTVDNVYVYIDTTYSSDEIAMREINRIGFTQ